MTSIKKKDSEHISWCVCYFFLLGMPRHSHYMGKCGYARRLTIFPIYPVFSGDTNSHKAFSDSIFGCVGRHYLLGGQTHLFIPLSIYIPAESSIPRYQELRSEMFLTSPPDAYYSCPIAQSLTNSPPQVVTQDYVQLSSIGKPSCLYIKKVIAKALTPDQWQRLHDLGFSQL